MSAKDQLKSLNRAAFVMSAPTHHTLPTDEGGEVAFAGRSNAGKSSALNALTGHHSLARVSKTPGRTQHLVVFEVAAGQRLIDLPGYGYAKVPPALRAAWGEAMRDYFAERQSLRGLIICMDVRHPLTDFDTMMLDFCDDRRLDCHILLTKCDKLSRGAAGNTLQAVRKALREAESAATVQVFSAQKGDGLDEARSWVMSRLL
jgi:GTP-binding protein